MTSSPRAGPNWTFVARGAVGLMLVLSASTSPLAPAAAARACAQEPAKVLATFPAGQSGLRYALAVDPCQARRCRMRIQLLRESKVLDSVLLEWASPSRQLQLQGVEPGWGVGDVLHEPKEASAWTAEIEDTGFVTFARSVEFAPGRTGLLVTQRTGVEPVKRRHVIYLIQGDRLVTAWTRSEGASPTWSATDLVPLRDGRQQVLYQGGIDGGGNQADRVDLQTIGWDDRLGTVGERPAEQTVPLKLVSAGVYPTVAAAYQARTRGSCLFRYWILDASSFDGLPPSGYFLAGITADARVAEQVVSEAKQCQPPIPAVVLTYKKRR